MEWRAQPDIECLEDIPDGGFPGMVHGVERGCVTIDIVGPQRESAAKTRPARIPAHSCEGGQRRTLGTIARRTEGTRRGTTCHRTSVSPDSSGTCPATESGV